MTVLVTGGAGFIGQHLVRRLLAQGEQVVVLDDLSGGGRPPGGARLVVGDVADPHAVAAAMRGRPSAVYHLAAVSSVPACEARPGAAGRTNVIGARVVASRAGRIGARLVYVSTVAPPERSTYGRTKRAGEREVLARGGAACRLHNVYGPGQPDRGGEGGAVAAFVAAARRGEPATIHGDGQQVRDFVHVEDVVDALLAAEPGVCEIGSGRLISISDLWTQVRYVAVDVGLPDPGRPHHAPARAGDVAAVTPAPQGRGCDLLCSLREMLAVPSPPAG